MTRLLCIDCGAEVEFKKGMRACPQCGSTSIPADLDDAVTIRITNHELRILTMWASNWARRFSTPETDMNKPISVILSRLATQTSAALTLGQEIADLRAALPGSQILIYEGGKESDL